jgi:cystinosin
VPQALRNYRRQSTSGWNVWNVLLDFSGGAFSMLQLLGDCWATDDWGGLTGDLVKFGLSVVTIFFDILFLFQHYAWYGDAKRAESVGSDASSFAGGEDSYQRVGDEKKGYV